MKQCDFLRKKHPKFIYRNFAINREGNSLKVRFNFHLEPDLDFHPEISILNIPEPRLGKIGGRALQNFAFHCGLSEMTSYWKTACSPEIVIEAGYLNKEQIRWWKDLFIRGMGQFFYENKIDFRAPKFLTMRAVEIETSQRHSNILQNVRMSGNSIFGGKLNDSYLVPMAGGRDSIVGAELLKKRGNSFNSFSVNPSREAKAVIKIAGIKNPIIVRRKVDPALLKLNKKGYLNGHTPLTSVLSFLAVFCAALFDFKYVAFSNEKSADEGNLKYLGREINHQYSKSSEFEKKFAAYVKKYLAESINYFSLLRPYTDLEISRMFLKHPKYFNSFSSCNRGVKLGKKWCGECPKCLFVYATLYPFLEKRTMLKIFGGDLFENKKLLPIARALIEPNRPKPFECVGTKKESREAFRLSRAKTEKNGRVPYLLRSI